MGCDGELGYSDIMRAEAAKSSGLVRTQMYAQLPLCVKPGTHYFQVDQIKRDTAVCTHCGLIRKQT